VGVLTAFVHVPLSTTPCIRLNLAGDVLGANRKCGCQHPKITVCCVLDRNRLELKLHLLQRNFVSALKVLARSVACWYWETFDLFTVSVWLLDVECMMMQSYPKEEPSLIYLLTRALCK